MWFLLNVHVLAFLDRATRILKKEMQNVSKSLPLTYTKNNIFTDHSKKIKKKIKVQGKPSKQAFDYLDKQCFKLTLEELSKQAYK
jgi:hypothetical protein